MTRSRTARVSVASTATVLAGTLGHVVALVGRSRSVEDLCTTRAPEGAWSASGMTETGRETGVAQVTMDMHRVPM